jgi:CheY-like chemotaxis protein
VTRPSTGSPDPDAPKAQTPLAGIRLLVVEDDETARASLVDLLGAAGAEVASAPDAEAAVAHLAGTGSVDVVLTGLRLPGPSGIWLADWCIGNLPCVPVVLLSAFLPPSGTILPESVRHFVRRPFQPDALLAIVARAAGRPPAEG